MERLRPLLLAISIDDDSSWGIAWGVLFDAILEVQQAKPNEIEVRVVQIPAGEAGVLYRCLVRTVVHELDLKVATAIDERQMGLFS